MEEFLDPLGVILGLSTRIDLVMAYAFLKQSNYVALLGGSLIVLVKHLGVARLYQEPSQELSLLICEAVEFKHVPQLLDRNLLLRLVRFEEIVLDLVAVESFDLKL